MLTQPIPDALGHRSHRGLGVRPVCGDDHLLAAFHCQPHDGHHRLGVSHILPSAQPDIGAELFRQRDQGRRGPGVQPGRIGHQYCLGYGATTAASGFGLCDGLQLDLGHRVDPGLGPAGAGSQPGYPVGVGDHHLSQGANRLGGHQVQVESDQRLTDGNLGPRLDLGLEPVTAHLDGVEPDMQQHF